MNQQEKDKIVRKLIDTNTTISTMESCTSGLIASMITDTEGASAVFPGGYVTYLNKTKILCGVDEKIIKEHGVYSKQCARAMAETAQKTFIQRLRSESQARPEMSTRIMQTACREKYFSVFLWERMRMTMNTMRRSPR